MALDEAENSLQAEETKVQRAQMEVVTIRQEIEKRIQEKEVVGSVRELETIQ